MISKIKNGVTKSEAPTVYLKHSFLLRIISLYRKRILPNAINIKLIRFLIKLNLTEVLVNGGLIYEDPKVAKLIVH